MGKTSLCKAPLSHPWLLALGLTLFVCLAGCTHRAPEGGLDLAGASPWNDVLAKSRQDLDCRQTPIDPAVPVPAWELTLRWSRDGLGGADRYLGVGQDGIPLAGGATPPDWVLIGPGQRIAVDDRGTTRLYDHAGAYLGQRPQAAGFLPDGGLVTYGPPGLAAFAPDGSALWTVDPWAVARDTLGKSEEIQLNSGQAFVSPAGVTYFSFDYQVKGNDGMFAGLMAFDWCGVGLGCETVPSPISMMFLEPGAAQGRDLFVAGGVPTETGVAFRVFAAHGLTFNIQRTIYVPGGAIYGGKDGVYLIRQPVQGDSLTEAFTVYREGASRALSFTLPAGYHFQVMSADGLLYATKLTEDCLVIGAWACPEP